MPKVVLASENLSEALRDATSLLGLSIAGLEGGGRKGKEAERAAGRQAMEGLLEQGRMEGMLRMIEERQGEGAREGQPREREEEEEGEEEEDLGTESEEEETEEEEDLEDEEEEDFYALVSSRARKGAVRQEEEGEGAKGWGVLGMQGEEEDDEEEGGGTRVVGVGGKAHVSHRVSKGGTIVVQLGAGKARKRPRY